MSRWKITIEYDGRLYAGFQKQPDIGTIQEEIETAIQKFCQKETPITVAGRTDSGVHARAQVAHFDLDFKKADGTDRFETGFELAKAINAHLMPQPIVIIDAVRVADDFHARFGAKAKHYQYKIINRPYGLSIDQGFAWWRKTPLDVDAMNEAAKFLIGKHDFTTFRDTECQANTAIRTLDELYVEAFDILNGQEILVHAKGMSFLHHMVRNIVGTLSLVGEGKWKPEDVQKALEAKDRTAGGPTAPSDGLYLISIDYK